MLEILSRKCRKEILEMIMGAGSGHIGGAMSSIDIYLAVLNEMTDNDRLVVSHGHTSAALYAALGNFGYFDIAEATANFRRNAPYEGHPSLAVNGVEWCSGSLGQGLSVGAGFALAKKAAIIRRRNPKNFTKIQPRRSCDGRVVLFQKRNDGYRRCAGKGGCATHLRQAHGKTL